MDNKKSNIFWSNSERDHSSHKKTIKSSTLSFMKTTLKQQDHSPLVTTITYQPEKHELEKDQDEIFTKNTQINNEENKIGIKDLCSEDKARIANLVKELAKKDAEKDDIKKCLENERQLYEKRLKEMLEQQEKLLKEKETLLLNFAEKQTKLEKLLDKKERKGIKLLKQQKPSSTPNNCSLRSISPILNNAIVENKRANEHDKNKFTKEIDLEIVKLKGKPLLNSTIINDVTDDCATTKNQSIPQVENNNNNNSEMETNARKQQLIQQRIDLMNEQKLLKHLIDQQEKLLTEKNDQIMLQQKLHRERLENLITKANESPSSVPARTSQQVHSATFNHHQQPVNRVIPPLQADLSTLNMNSPKGNVLTSSFNSSKLKQENSFDIFELISNEDHNHQIANSNHKTEHKIPMQNHKQQNLNTNFLITASKTFADDADETKLFEDIFFVN